MKTEQKEIKYTKEQNGYLSQEIVNLFKELRPKATDKEIEMIDVLVSTIQMSSYGVSTYDINRIKQLLEEYSKEVKNARIAKLKQELATLEGS